MQKKTQITVHKFWNRGKRQVEMNIMTHRCDSSAELEASDWAQSKASFKKKKKYNIWFWECFEISKAIFFIKLIKSLSTRDSAFGLNRGRHHGDIKGTWSWWWTNYKLRLWIQPLGPSSPPTLRAHPNSWTTSEDELRRVQIAVSASFWPQCVSLSYCCWEEKKNRLYTQRICLSFKQLWSVILCNTADSVDSSKLARAHQCTAGCFSPNVTPAIPQFEDLTGGGLIKNKNKIIHIIQGYTETEMAAFLFHHKNK